MRVLERKEVYLLKLISREAVAPKRRKRTQRKSLAGTDVDFGRKHHFYCVYVSVYLNIYTSHS